MNAKRGRPRKANPKSARMDLRMEPELYDRIKTAADAQGIPAAEYVRRLLIAATGYVPPPD